MPAMTGAGGGATRLVGRERELEAMLDAAAAALAGRSGTVLLEGSSGMGATRLIDEALARLPGEMTAGGSAPVVIRGDDLPAWRRAPYAPFRVALEGLLAERSPDDALALLGSGLDLLLPLLPQAAARLSASPPGPPVAERLADRIHEAFRGLIGRLAAEGPVVVIVEDLHVLDAASRSLLAFLARTLGGRPVFLVGSFQPEALGPGHPLRATLDAVASGPRPPRRVALPPLDRAALRTLIASHEGENPSAPTLLLVAERSGGSPLIAEEVLVARRELSGAALSVPLVQMVVARAARRTPECRRVLRILAVADGPLEPARLGAIAAAYDADIGRPAPRSSAAPRRGGGGLPGDLAAGVDEAIAHGFVEVGLRHPGPARPAGARSGERKAAPERILRIRHELISGALNADLLPGPRRRMHAALAGALVDRPEEAGPHWGLAHETERELRSQRPPPPEPRPPAPPPTPWPTWSARSAWQGPRGRRGRGRGRRARACWSGPPRRPPPPGTPAGPRRSWSRRSPAIRIRRTGRRGRSSPAGWARTGSPAAIATVPWPRSSAPSSCCRPGPAWSGRGSWPLRPGPHARRCLHRRRPPSPRRGSSRRGRPARKRGRGSATRRARSASSTAGSVGRTSPSGACRRRSRSPSSSAASRMPFGRGRTW